MCDAQTLTPRKGTATWTASKFSWRTPATWNRAQPEASLRCTLQYKTTGFPLPNPITPTAAAAWLCDLLCQRGRGAAAAAGGGGRQRGVLARHHAAARRCEGGPLQAAAAAYLCKCPRERAVCERHHPTGACEEQTFGFNYDRACCACFMRLRVLRDCQRSHSRPVVRSTWQFCGAMTRCPCCCCR